MTVEELETEGEAIVKKFEADFEGVIRPFYRSMKAFTEKVEASPASNRTKQALLLAVLDALNGLGNIADRVGAEEGIS